MKYMSRIINKCTYKMIKSLYKNYIEGYNEYRNMNFAEAKKSFQKSLSSIPNDQLSKIYLERCENYIINPPSSDWDAISHLTTK